MRSCDVSPARAIWKAYWRQLRIIRRETLKQFADVVIFGSGFLQVGPDVPDGIRHVPFLFRDPAA